MQNAPQNPRPKVNVYFDGFNFYYGCFKNRKRNSIWRTYKWLNLEKYCVLMFPEYKLNRIRYFTARVNPTHPSLDQGQSVRQATYLRALSTIPCLTVHEGHFTIQRKQRLIADALSESPIPEIPFRYETVLIPEEKGSDVNLATYLLVDAFRSDFDVAVVVSNDSDLAEPIRILTTEIGKPVVVLNPQIRSSFHLKQLPGVTHRELTLKALKAAQFPAALNDSAGTITKPPAW